MEHSNSERGYWCVCVHVCRRWRLFLPMTVSLVSSWWMATVHCSAVCRAIPAKCFTNSPSICRKNTVMILTWHYLTVPACLQCLTVVNSYMTTVLRSQPYDIWVPPMVTSCRQNTLAADYYFDAVLQTEKVLCCLAFICHAVCVSAA